MRGASRAAAVIRTPHMLTRFRMLGTRVSPAPRMAPAEAMDTAYRGSAKASMRSTCTPSVRTAGSGVSRANTAGANQNMRAPMRVIRATASSTHIRANRRARSRRFAPRLCPTSVVAAAATP